MSVQVPVQWTSWVKQPKRKAHHAPSSIITVKNAWNNMDSSSCGFKAWSVLSTCKYIEHKFSRSTNTRGSITQLQGLLSLMWNLYILLVLNNSTSCCLYVFCYYHILSYSLGSVFINIWLYSCLIL